MDFHVLTTHRGPVDETPLQMISAQQLAYYQGVEAAYIGLLERLAEPAGETPDPPLPSLPDPPLPSLPGHQHAPCRAERDSVACQQPGGGLTVDHPAQELSEGN